MQKRYAFAITGFTPSSVNAGMPSDTTIGVLGGPFPLGAVVYYNGVSVATMYISAAQVNFTLTVAQAATGGYRNIQVRSGTDFSNTKLFPVLLPTPTLASISPTFKYLGTGPSSTTGTGTGIQPDTDVLVDGALATGTLTPPSTAVALLANLVIDDAGDHTVQLSNPPPGGGLSAVATLQVRYKPAAITSKSVSLIQIDSPDTPVTLNDTNGGYYKAADWPDGGTTATVDDVPVALTYVSPTQVQIVIPASMLTTPGTKVIKVTNPNVGGGGGTSAGSNVSVSAPTTTGLSFSSRVRGFDQFKLRVLGTNLSATDTVVFSGVDLATTYVNGTTLEGLVTAPLLAVSGLVSVTVRTATGYETNAQAFTIKDWQYSRIGPTLRGFFDGSSLANDGNGRVSAWNDVYASGRNPSQATSGWRPLIAAGVTYLNGKTAAFFDGTRGDYLEYTPGWIVSGSAGFVTKTQYQVFAVGAALASAQINSNPTLLGEPGPFINVGNLQNDAIRFTDNSVNALVSFVWATGAAFLVEARKAGGFLTERVNNGPESTPVASNDTYSPAALLIGRGRSGTWLLTGWIGAWLACDSSINHTNAWQVRNLLAYEYGIAARTVSGTLVAPTACSPSTVEQYSVPVQLTITCAAGGLAAGAVVNLDGFVLASIVDSATQIRATLTPEALMEWGDRGLTIGNSDGIGQPLLFVVTQYVPSAGPNLTAISPTTKQRYKNQFQMTATGSNFTPSSVLYIGATPLVTIFDGPTQLRATVPATIMDTAGPKNVTVVDPGGTSSPQVLTVTDRNESSLSGYAANYPAGSVSTSGSACTQWNDTSGNSRNMPQATGSKQGVYSASDSNFAGAPTVNFDGVNDDYVGSTAISSIFTSNAQYTCAIACRADTITGTGSSSLPPINNNNPVGLATSGFFGMALKSPNILWGFTNDGAYKLASSTAAAAGVAQQYVYTKGGGQLDVYVNGVQGTPITGVGASGYSSQFLSLGSCLGAYYYDGQLAHAVFCSQFWVPDDFELWNNLCRARFGIM